MQRPFESDQTQFESENFQNKPDENQEVHSREDNMNNNNNNNGEVNLQLQAQNTGSVPTPSAEPSPVRVTEDRHHEDHITDIAGTTHLQESQSELPLENIQPDDQEEGVKIEHAQHENNVHAEPVDAPVVAGSNDDQNSVSVNETVPVVDNTDESNSPLQPCHRSIPSNEANIHVPIRPAPAITTTSPTNNCITGEPCKNCCKIVNKLKSFKINACKFGGILAILIMIIKCFSVFLSS